MGEEASPPLIQVTNVSPQATDQQMKELFSYLGRIKDIKVYPGSGSPLSFPSRVCFVRFVDISGCQTALHLTNSILVDRALIVVKSKYSEVPDEKVALSLAAPAIAVANVGAQQPLTHTAPLLPTPPNLLNMSSGIMGSSVLGNPPTTAATVAAFSAAIPGFAGITPGITPGVLQLPAAAAVAVPAPILTKPLISIMGTVVPQPPPLTGNVDPTKIEEIRRTVYVGNLSTKPETAEQVLAFFQPCGEIKYVRMAGDETQPTRVNHSKNAIVKPQGPTPQEEKREVEEAMKRIEAANKALAKAIDTSTNSEKSKSDKRKKSRSRSHSRSPSRSRSRGHRRRGSRSRSKDRRKRSYSRSPRRRSPRRRSRSPPRYSGGRYSSSRRDYGYNSRRSPSPRDRGRHRDRDRERERERDRERREREKERERDRRDRRRRSVSGSPRRSPHKSRSSRKREKRELSRTPSPRPASPSHSSSKRSKRSRKEKKKRHRRSPSYSASPTPSAQSDSHSPSQEPKPEPAAGRGAGSLLWGSEEEGGAEREGPKEVIKADEGGSGDQSSAGESEGEVEGGEESEGGGRGTGEESEGQEEELSDVE